MGLEVERKFLVRSGWRPDAEPGSSATPMRQGYLAGEDGAHVTVRVRVAGAAGFLTIKGKALRSATEPAQALERLEFEYPIPLADAETLLGLSRTPLVEKVRYRLPHAGRVWEVDVFGGDNAGLIVAELELSRADEPFERPPWLGLEVTQDERYANAALARRPYRSWAEAERQT